jgi:hypothetical protein
MRAPGKTGQMSDIPRGKFIGEKVGGVSLTPTAAAELVNGLNGILTAISKGPTKTN